RHRGLGSRQQPQGAGPPEVPPEEPPPAPGDVAAVGPGSQPGGGRVVVAEVRRAGQLHPRGHPRTRRRGDRPAHPTEVRPGPLESALEPQQTAVPDATEPITLLTCESVALLCPLPDRPEPVALQLLAVNPRCEARPGATVQDPAG